METALEIDPDFPAALNRFGYVYMQTGNPDPAKAIASLKHYAQVEPRSPNPEDSLGEIFRIAGHDQSSLEHYRAALRIDPNYLASQVGLGDSFTLMGDSKRARAEYDRAIKMADNPRDELWAKYQKTLPYFGDGQAAEGRQALDLLFVEAANKKEPNSVSDIGLGSAMLAADPREELAQLGALAVFLERPLPGMSEADRGVARTSTLRERVRVASLNGLMDNAAEALARLATLASSSGDILVQTTYESARGYLSFGKGDFADAVDQLAADSHSALAMRQLAILQEKLGDNAAAQLTRARLNFRRSPTVEWYLVDRASGGDKSR
jgi:tetratricopeptide (TPR) repeat protein